jgi:hypothetical protein
MPDARLSACLSGPKNAHMPFVVRHDHVGRGADHRPHDFRPTSPEAGEDDEASVAARFVAGAGSLRPIREPKLDSLLPIKPTPSIRVPVEDDQEPTSP